MSRLRLRLARLFTQSHIRLSAADLVRRPAVAGDRVEIGSRLWRVDSVDERGRATLVALEGAPRRAHLAPAADRGWTLDDGGVALTLEGRDVVVFPVAAEVTTGV